MPCIKSHGPCRHGLTSSPLPSSHIPHAFQMPTSLYAHIPDPDAVGIPPWEKTTPHNCLPGLTDDCDTLTRTHMLLLHAHCHLQQPAFPVLKLLMLGAETVPPPSHPPPSNLVPRCCSPLPPPSSDLEHEALLPPVRQRELNLPVQATRTQQCRVQRVGTIGGHDHLGGTHHTHMTMSNTHNGRAAPEQQTCGPGF